MRQGVLTLMAVLGSAALAVPADLAEIRSRGVLRVLVNLDEKRPEFFALSKDKAPGFDHELLQSFAQLHRLRLEAVSVDGWGALVPALLERRGDLIAGRFTDTPARRRQITFTAEVFPSRLVVITRKPHRAVTSLEQLREEKVGTTKGSSMAEALAATGIPPENLDQEIPTGGYCQALREGRITAAVWGVECAIASQREDPEIQLGMFLGAPASLAWGVRREDGQLLSALGQYIQNVRRTPTWNRLVVEYFGAAALDILKQAQGR